jgi:hypothetical protein
VHRVVVVFVIPKTERTRDQCAFVYTRVAFVERPHVSSAPERQHNVRVIVEQKGTAVLAQCIPAHRSAETRDLARTADRVFADVIGSQTKIPCIKQLHDMGFSNGNTHFSVQFTRDQTK